MDTPITIAAGFLCASMLWTLFLIYDENRRSVRSSNGLQLSLLCHNIPAILVLFTTNLASSVNNTALIWFIALMLFRYWRTVINI